MKQIEASLKRLQTDKVDMLKIHAIESIEDVNKMSKNGQFIKVVYKLKEPGVTQFIGFSGHGNASAMKAMIDSGNLDIILIALNHWSQDKNSQESEELAIPATL